MSLKINSTGYWGVPGKRPSKPWKVHAVSNGKPICGQRIDRNAEYQWCAHGLSLAMIDCAKCRDLIAQNPPEVPVRSINKTPVTVMGRRQALEELDRIHDNLLTLQQHISNLASRTVKARTALQRRDGDE